MKSLFRCLCGFQGCSERPEGCERPASLAWRSIPEGDSCVLDLIEDDEVASSVSAGKVPHMLIVAMRRPHRYQTLDEGDSSGLQ